MSTFKFYMPGQQAMVAMESKADQEETEFDG
jgi:hypothetical protein